MFNHPELGIRIEHRQVGSQHIFTSPDVPGLYVAHTNQAIAEQSIPSAVEMLRNMEKRQTARDRIAKRTAAS